jgi:hypothetical protein
LIPSVTAVIESILWTTFQPLIRFFFYRVVIFAFWAGDFSERPVAVVSFAVVGDALDFSRGTLKQLAVCGSSRGETQ